MAFNINTGLEQELVADGSRLADALKAAGYEVKYQNFPRTDHMGMASSRPDLMQVVLEALGKAGSTQPSLTPDGNGCTYSGQTELPTTFTLSWQVADLGHSAYIYTIATLDEGKTIEDVALMPAEDPAPEWFHKISVDFTPRPGTFTKAIDQTANSLFKGGPVYFACFFSDADVAIGAAGPFDVKN